MATSNTFDSLKPLTKEVTPKFSKIKNLFRKKRSKLVVTDPLKQKGK